MEQKKLKAIALALEKELRHHDRLYHGEDRPEISDYEYDLLRARLSKLYKEHPALRGEESVLAAVGYKKKKGFSSFTHRFKMYSLENAMSEEELENFFKKHEALGAAVWPVSLSLKFDGLALELIYEKGELIAGATRGDGEVGENVTDNLWQIKNLPPSPLAIEKEAPPAELIVRGEAVLLKNDFKELNEQLLKEGLPAMSSLRNAAAGSLRQLKLRSRERRRLCFFSYELANWEALCRRAGLSELAKHSGAMKFLRELGFEDGGHVQVAENVEAVKRYLAWVTRERFNFPYEIDGVVIKLDSGWEQKRVGVAGRKPRYAVAWKLPTEIKESKLLAVEFQVGRTGQITPVGLIEEVELSGARVSRVTLHNKREIEEKGLKLGDRIRIIRSGEVIPKLLAVVKEARDGSERELNFPSTCPACGRPLKEEKSKTQAEAGIRFCLNRTCPKKQLRQLVHFVSKAAMNLEGISERVIETLIRKEKLKKASDFYQLRGEDFEGFERMGKKLKENFLRAISSSKEVPLANFLFALGIRELGRETAQLLAEKYVSLENFLKLSDKRAPEELDFSLEFLTKSDLVRLVRGRSFSPLAKAIFTKEKSSWSQLCRAEYLGAEVNRKLVKRLSLELLKQYGEKISALSQQLVDFLGKHWSKVAFFSKLIEENEEELKRLSLRKFSKERLSPEAEAKVIEELNKHLLTVPAVTKKAKSTRGIKGAFFILSKLLKVRGTELAASVFEGEEFSVELLELRTQHLKQAFSRAAAGEREVFETALFERQVSERITEEVLSTLKALVDKSVVVEQFLAKEELKEIDGIGESLAKRLIEFLWDEAERAEVAALLRGGVKVMNFSAGKKSGGLSGKKVLFSGRLSVPRHIAKEKAKAAGAQVAASVSKRLDYLIIGEDPGSKAKQAHQLGIKLLTERAFLNLIE